MSIKCKECEANKIPYDFIVKRVGACRKSDRKLFDSDSTTLTYDNVVEMYEKQNGRCSIYKMPLTFNTSGKPTEYNLSVDRINPDLPHTAENCQLIIAAANVRAKGRLV